MIVDQFDDKFIHFQQSISSIQLPEKFTFPFQYEPHPLALLATEELISYLQKTDFNHNFGIDSKSSTPAIGKMFGVLVVRKPDQTIGFLAAFSGKLGDKNHHAHFVPPLFDMLAENSYFLLEEEQLNAINNEIESLENNPEYVSLLNQLQETEKSIIDQLNTAKQVLKNNKTKRKSIRDEQFKILNFAKKDILEADLIKQSLQDKRDFNTLQTTLNEVLKKLEVKLKIFTDKINDLKELRKQKSNQLQTWLFEQYQFLNQAKKTKNLLEIFATTNFPQPPAAAGDCAAPKLFQYAFQKGYQPICMAEFWWGDSPKSEIRKHQHFYPSCIGKCEPILSHMLNGIELDPNPLLINTGIGKEIEIIYEDDDFFILNKPEGLLTVPGIEIKDSVYERMSTKFPEISNHMIVHRLDMATSGILVLAKSKKSHKSLQRQFLKRNISKRYIALLDGILKVKSGQISLPLRVDLDDRPRQIVCYEFGKSATTNFQVLGIENNKTRIHFWPITGRTHQLRMHASHPLGLNTPIIGDDLYGTKSNRLHLHAEYIKLKHPSTGNWMEFTIPSEF